MPSRRLTVAALLCLTVPPVAAAQDAGRNDRLFVQAWQAVADKFYDPKMHGVDWAAVRDRYRPRAAAAASRPEFQAVVERMLAELRASHCGYFTADDFEYHFFRTVFMPDRPATAVEHIGVMGGRHDGVFVVQGCLEGGPAARAGVKAGDRLLDAGGAPFTTSGAFRGRAGTPVELTLDRPGEGRKSVAVTPVKENPVEAYAAATRASARVVERGGKRFGYVHLWCLTHKDLLRAFEYAVRVELIDTDGLVLDLRDGYGGSPGWFDYVFFQPAVEMKVTPRGGKPAVERSGYGRPVVVLVNGGTRSAKEYLAYELKKAGRAVLVGERTAGAFLGAGGVPVGDDGLLMLPVSDLAVDGRRLEGVGVRPDYEVAAADAYGPADRQLAKAVDVLRGGPAWQP